VNHDVLSAALAAVRAAGDTDAGELALATRSRLRRSLEVRVRRHRLVRLGTVMAVLLVSTGAWAWSTGRLPFLSRTSPPVLAPSTAIERQPESPRTRRVAREPALAVPDAAWPTPVPAEPTPPPKQNVPRRPVTVPAVPAVPAAPTVPTVIEKLYTKAHELHFRGGDHVAALAAWDAYLAAEPSGRFAIEGRYNRALVLVRLGRHHDARTALVPYAAGEVAVGYLKAEAAQLVERAHIERAHIERARIERARVERSQ
jgi:hypothetical protein